MRTVKLNNIGIGRYDDVSPFIITNGEIQMNIELPSYNGEFYLTAENNGRKFKQKLINGGTVIIDNLTAGELKAEVKHYVKGELVKVYKIETLLIKELDMNLSVSPEITAINERITNLNSRLESLAETISNSGKEQMRLHNHVLGLLKFAYSDYTKNVYLSGGKFADFIKEFGFEITDEEKRIIEEN